MHKNRLIELTQISPKSQRLGSKLSLPPSIQQYRQRNTQMENQIDRMMNNNQELAELTTQLQRVAVPEKEKKLHERFDEVIQENRKIMSKIQKEIEEMKKKVEKGNEKDKKSDFKTAMLIQKAVKAITQFRQKQQKFTNVTKGMIWRQMDSLKTGITEDQVENIMKNPEIAQSMLQAKLLDETSDELENNLSDIIDKTNAIRELQISMNECLEMQRELALLVALTGEQLDSIENTIEQAEDYTVKAENKLVQAKKQAKSMRKKMCCIIILLLGAIGAVLIPVLLKTL